MLLKCKLEIKKKILYDISKVPMSGQLCCTSGSLCSPRETAVGHSSPSPKGGVSGRTEGSVPECLSFLRTLTPSPFPDMQWIEVHA